jgi:hypothetical protein
LNPKIKGIAHIEEQVTSGRLLPKIAIDSQLNIKL